MNPSLQIEKVVIIREPHAGNDLIPAPQLEVEWSSRWQEFFGSIGPALKRSEARLAGEAPFGLIPLRIVIPSYVVEALVIFIALAIHVKVNELKPRVIPRFSSHDVIYYTGDELPRTEDLGGADAGTRGQAGGEEAYHRTQTIRVARGASLVPRVVDAPNLALPSSTDAVANLLAVHPDPGPPPAEGLRSSRSAVNLASSVVAPSPRVAHDYTRNGIDLNTVIAPAPTVTRDRSLMAPTLSPTLIAPAPNVASDHALVAPRLAPSVIPPAPNVARARPFSSPSLNEQVVAPAPDLPRDQTRSALSLNSPVVAPAPNVSASPRRSAPALSGSVIPPAPGAVGGERSRAPVEMTAAAVPPPVSAPERAARSNSLRLPPPSVVAPPPSADLSHDMRHLANGSVDPGKAVVPPPPSQSSSGSFMSSLIGKLFGSTEVVPPPPPVTENRDSRGSTLGPNVVAPPPSVSAGTGSHSRWTGPTMSSPNVVPPPPSLAGAGGGTGETPGGKGVNGGTLLVNNIVPPPPTVGGGSSSGSGPGRKGTSLGAPTDVGSALAPPHTGGSGVNAGAVISSQPGTTVGVPRTNSVGSIAMSPSGGEKPGLGSSGAGSSIAHGNGSGTAMNGAGSGAVNTGAGHGAEANAGSGISTSNGPGGAGNRNAGNPAVPKVDISGGSTIVTLPGFGTDSNGDDGGAATKRTPVNHSQKFDVTIVATASSGGAFEPYKNLLHGTVYTTYVDTSLGSVVMEYAENASLNTFAAPLSAPSAVRTELPAGLPRARLVIACTLDGSGNLKNPKVLEAGPAEMTMTIISALRSWKFQPAMRNNQPVEVTAILGFGINTDDRF